MNQVLAAIAKAVLVTLISTVATIAVEKIKQYNEEKHEFGWNQSGYDDYDHW